MRDYCLIHNRATDLYSITIAGTRYHSHGAERDVVEWTIAEALCEGGGKEEIAAVYDQLEIITLPCGMLRILLNGEVLR